MSSFPSISLKLVKTPRTGAGRQGVATSDLIATTPYFTLGGHSDVGAGRTCIDGTTRVSPEAGGARKKP